MTTRITLLLLLTLTLCGTKALANPADSVGVETAAGKRFVLHKVEPKETLFSIARKYKAIVSEIKASNADVANGLKTGQVIKVPVPLKMGTVKKSLEPAVALAKVKPGEPGKTKPKEHIVAPGQSLTAIAKMYKLSVDDLKRYNNLADDNISVGQKLNLGPNGSISVPKPAEPLVSDAPVKADIKTPAATTATNSKNDKIDLSASGFEKITETGLAEPIEDAKPGKMHLCLHKTAATGTILEVKNEQNGKTIFCRVIGKLPETGPNEKLLLRLSKKAYDSLNPASTRFPVVVSYPKP